MTHELGTMGTMEAEMLQAIVTPDGVGAVPGIHIALFWYLFESRNCI
jgi:hypothetical protein